MYQQVNHTVCDIAWPPATLQVPPTDRLTDLHFLAVSDRQRSQSPDEPRLQSDIQFSSLPGWSCWFLAVSMSVAVAEGCFLSALQPNSSCTAYVLPSDGPSQDPVAKARRVREQVRMRLAEKKSSSLPRLDDSLLGETGELHHTPRFKAPKHLK